MSEKLKDMINKVIDEAEKMVGYLEDEQAENEEAREEEEDIEEIDNSAEILEINNAIDFLKDAIGALET